MEYARCFLEVVDNKSYGFGDFSFKEQLPKVITRIMIDVYPTNKRPRWNLFDVKLDLCLFLNTIDGKVSENGQNRWTAKFFQMTFKDMRRSFAVLPNCPLKSVSSP